MLIPRFYHGAIEGKHAVNAQKVTEQVPVWKNGRELAQSVHHFADSQQRCCKNLQRRRVSADFSGKLVAFERYVGYAGSTFAVLAAKIFLGVFVMQWTAPAFEEVCLNCEINSYASAKL